MADIAGCLADVLRCTAGDNTAAFVEGKHYLKVLIQQLSSMRGKESRYLKPLMAKTEGLLDFPLNGGARAPSPSPSNVGDAKNNTNGGATTPGPTPGTPSGFATPTPSNPQDFFRGRAMSLADSVGMLRSMSMCGTLGMPTLSIPVEDWMMRGGPTRPALNPAEAAGIQNWSFGGAAA